MNDFFQPIYDLPDSLDSRLRPVASEQLIRFASGRDGFEAYIPLNVLKAIAHEAVKAKKDETIGLLAGRVWRDNQGEYVVILAIEGAQKNEIEAGPSHVRISAASNAKVRDRLESKHLAFDLIGWYHSHPTFPPEFSSVDREEQSTWKDPNSIGIVYSGLSFPERFGVYRGPHGEKLFQQGGHLPVPVSDANLELMRPEIRDGVSASISRVLEPAQHETATKIPTNRKDANLALWLIAFGTIGLLTAGILWTGYRAQRVEDKLTDLLTNLSQQLSKREASDRPEPKDEQKKSPNGTAPPQGEQRVNVSQQAASQSQQPASKRPRQNIRRNARKVTKPDASTNQKPSAGKAEQPDGKREVNSPKPQIKH